MIGTNIRSVRHLFRVSDTHLKTCIIRFREAWDICKVIKMPKNSPFDGTMFIFNNSYKETHWDYESLVSSSDFKKYVDPSDIIFSRGRLISAKNDSDFVKLGRVICEIILLPDSFEKDYEKFTRENTKLISTLKSKFDFNVHNVMSKLLYVYTEDSKNFFQWAVIAMWQNQIPLSVVRSILIWNESYKQLSKNLSKGTITAYNSRESISFLMTELSELRKEKRINDSINSFNTMQKKMFKEHELSSDVKQALWRFSRLSETKQVNFIKKVSSIDDFNELVKQLKFATSIHFEWNKESFLDFIKNVENINCEKIYENENIVLLKVFDYETIKQLGKTTNWCISKNKQYWNNYIENFRGMATQYVIFDFSKNEDDRLSIVGFTVTNNKGITSAHNFINENLMGGEQDEHISLNSFISRFREHNGIFSILNNDGIDITMVVHYDAPLYKWDKKSLMEYLYECVNRDNVEILKDDGNKMALSVVDENIRYFLGDVYGDNIPSEEWGLKHILFIDFGKSQYDVNKLQFAIIKDEWDEEHCVGLFNERFSEVRFNFNSKLVEFGLPYNTIRRVDDLSARLVDALTAFNMPMIRECLKECNKGMLRKVITEKFGEDGWMNLVLVTIRDYLSFDYIDLIYNNGLKLRDIISQNSIGKIIKDLLSDMVAMSRVGRNLADCKEVTNKDIEDFFNSKTACVEETRYIGSFILIKKIILMESNDNREINNLLKRPISYIVSNCKQGGVFDQIMMFSVKYINFSKSDDCTCYLTRYVAYNPSAPIRGFVEKAIEGNENLWDFYVNEKSTFEKAKASRISETPYYAYIPTYAPRL